LNLKLLVYSSSSRSSALYKSKDATKERERNEKKEAKKSTP
jgi:hypothetical protein